MANVSRTIEVGLFANRTITSVAASSIHFWLGDGQPYPWPSSDDQQRPYQVAELHDACVVGGGDEHDREPSEGLVYTQSTIFNSDHAFATELTIPVARNHTVYHDEHHPLASAIQPFGSQVYHLVAETLPKLAALLLLRERSLPRMRILLPGPPGAHLTSCVTQLVEAIGLSRPPAVYMDTHTWDGSSMGSSHPHHPHHSAASHSASHSSSLAVAFLYGEPGVHHCARRLLVPPPAARNQPGMGTLSLLRRAFALKTPPPALIGGAGSAHHPHVLSVLAVARTNTSRARWANQQACLTALATDLPRLLQRRTSTQIRVSLFDGAQHPGVRSMAEAFGRADLMLGPHGSGFTGILFAAAGSGVLEVKTKFQVTTFERLCRLLSMEYRALAYAKGFHQSPSVTVNETSLVQAAAEMLGVGPRARVDSNG